MKIIQDGDTFGDYAKFKAFVQGISAPILWEENGGMLLVLAIAEGSRFLWCTTDAGAKSTFHTDFDATAYELD